MTKVKQISELTPYELWQMEKYQSIAREHTSIRDNDDWDDTWQDDTLDYYEEFSNDEQKEVA